MTVSRLAISLDADLAERIRDAAGPGTISGWLADAAERKLRAQGLAEVVAAWEGEHGAFTDAEVRRARRELGIVGPSDVATSSADTSSKDASTADAS